METKTEWSEMEWKNVRSINSINVHRRLIPRIGARAPHPPAPTALSPPLRDRARVSLGLGEVSAVAIRGMTPREG